MLYIILFLLGTPSPAYRKYILQKHVKVEINLIPSTVNLWLVIGDCRSPLLTNQSK